MQPLRIKKVRVEGHTDDRGDAARNLVLSSRRAKAVQGWLVEHGVAQQRLEAQGFGADRPIASNERSAGRAKNRRVGFVILDANRDSNRDPNRDFSQPPPPALKKAESTTPAPAEHDTKARTHPSHRRHHHRDYAA